LYTIFLLALISVNVMFTKRYTLADENGLYNAIYMYRHYGKVTYPMQLEYTRMTIHPPTHYLIVAVLTKLGLQVFHAAGLPLVIIALLAFWAVLTSRFSLLEQFSVTTGFTLAALVYMPLFPLRPDMHVAFAWFCGMVFLEAARSWKWENKRLFVGSFFIAYGSGLHYWALASGLVLPAYFLYILVRPAGSRPWHKLAVMAGGALCFYLPWATFFVIPDYAAILQSLRSVNATGGGIAAAIRGQWEQLHLVDTHWPLELPFIGRAVFGPVNWLHIPPILCAMSVLFFRPSLRGLALPGAILPLFVFLAVSHKSWLFYFGPELILYSIAVSLVLLLALDWAWRSRGNGNTLLFVTVITLFSGAVLARSAPFAKMGVTWKLVDWDVSRAANRKILGANALVALNQCYAWYTGGADRLYWIVTPGIGWDWLERVNRPRHFDSLILINDSFANRRSTIPFPEFYLDRHLNLRGFYFSGRHEDRYYDTVLTVLHLTAGQGIPKEGFGYDRERGILNHYVEDPVGPWEFVTMKAFIGSPDELPGGAIYIQRFDMEPPVRNEPGLYAFVTRRENWLAERAQFSRLATIRDEVSMRMDLMPASEFLHSPPGPLISFADSSAVGR
jgi:hypothetical protein